MLGLVMTFPEYSLQIEFRGYQGTKGGVLEKDLCKVSGEICALSSDDVERVGDSVKQATYVCKKKAGVGTLRFEGELDLKNVFNALNNYFIKTRYLKSDTGLSLPEMIVLNGNGNICGDHKGLTIPGTVPTIVVINSPENSSISF